MVTLCTVAMAWRTRGSIAGSINHATACLCIACRTNACATALKIGCFCVWKEMMGLDTPLASMTRRRWLYRAAI
jgi:hypothetical protein